MSPNNPQDSGLEPRPLFPAVEAPEETVEVTGLFDPRPQDVRPWDLFQRQDVVEEGLGLTPEESHEAEAQELVEGLEGAESALEEAGLTDDVEPDAMEAADEAPDTVTLSAEEMDARDLWSRTGEPKGVVLPSGVRVIDMYEGDGPLPAKGDRVWCHFKVWPNGWRSGPPADSSFVNTRPYDWALQPSPSA